MSNILYDGTAMYGRIKAVIGGVVGSILVLILMIGGGWLSIKQPTLYYDRNGGITNNIQLGVKQVEPSTVRTAGIIMLIAGLIIGLLIFGYIYLTIKYKPFASITGGVEAVSDIANIFR